MFSRPERFEEIALLHRSIRSLTASTLAKLQGRQYVSAKQLYCGSDCSDAFIRRRFSPVMERPLLSPTAGLWCQVNKKTRELVASSLPPRYIRLSNSAQGTVRDSDGKSKGELDLLCGQEYALHIGGSQNPLDGIVTLRSDEGKVILEGIDCKHVQSNLRGEASPLSLPDLIALVHKRRMIQAALQEETARGKSGLGEAVDVLMVVTVLNKRRKPPVDVYSLWLSGENDGSTSSVLSLPPNSVDSGNSADHKPNGVARTESADDWTCVISPSSNNLSWSLSPVLNYIFARDL